MAYRAVLTLLVLSSLPQDTFSLCDAESAGGVCKDILLPPDRATCIDPATSRLQPQWPCGDTLPPVHQQQRDLDDEDIDQLINLIKKELDEGQEEAGLEVGVMGSQGDTCNVHVKLADTKTAPYMRYAQANTGSQYLLLMVDPDTPGCQDAAFMCCFLHWVVSDIPGSSLLTPTQLTNGTTLLEYTPPRPPSGEHRYQFLLFELAAGSGVSDIPDSDRRANFDLNYLIGVHDLCHRLQAAFQYRATAGE